jgi:HEPN domain-containing protein
MMALSLQKAKLFEGVAFHAQQAAEKGLKAATIATGHLWERTHSCVDLLEALENEGFSVPPEVHEAAQRLDGQYLISRYPNGAGGPPHRLYNSRIARELLDAAERVLAFARDFSSAFEQTEALPEDHPPRESEP